MGHRRFLITFALVSLVVSGCASTRDSQLKVMACILGGGAVGGAVGQVISSNAGGVVGGGVGAVLGSMICGDTVGSSAPIDTDGDGVSDDTDRCPGTPAGVEVDEHGCPKDSDGDGVPDYLDECPDTPPGVAVDSRGCPPADAAREGAAIDSTTDSDGDGVPDYLDRCPDTPAGARVDEFGCPEVGEPLVVFDNDILFGFDSSVIRSEASAILDRGLRILLENPNLRVALRLEGHTDSVGPETYNQGLSERRAASAKRYLVSKGIAPERLETLGRGERFPVASNATSEGRRKNRRVEFIVIDK